MSSPKKTPATKTPDAEPVHTETEPLKDGTGDKKNEPMAIKQGDVGQPKPEDIIKTYKLKEGEYSINVKIMEATDLVPKKSPMFTMGNKDSSANPYVQVEFLGEQRKTKTQKKTLSPVYSEQFFFEKKMKKVELEEASIVFTVFDNNGLIAADTIIGSFELDITSVYFSYQHELYMTTLVLVDPTAEDFTNPSGMLKVCVQVLGPDDEPPVHDINFKKNPVGGAEGNVLRPLKCKPIGHEIEFNVYRAEHLPITDDIGAGIDAFVCIKYAGATKGTQIISDLNPEWNENIRLGCMLPNQSKAVNVELWDYDAFSKNDLISTFKVDFKSFQDKILPPKWGNLYGPPASAGDSKFADKMKLYGYDMGSHYCGRLLYSAGSYNNKHPKTKTSKIEFHFPDKPIATSPNKSYLLRVDLLEAIDTPPRDKCIIYFAMGPYQMKSDVRELKNGRASFYTSLEDKKLVMPVSVDEIPDLIVYFADEDTEDRRHSFCRIPASSILITDSKQHPTLKTIKLKEDKSLDLVDDSEFPGIVFAKLGLYSVAPPPRKIVDAKDIDYQQYQLRVFIYKARNLPPADAEGTSDPFFEISCAGVKTKTTMRENTLNPGFFETVTLDVELPNLEKPQEVPAGFSLYLYDADVKDDLDKDKDLIGRTYIKIDPKWVYYKNEKERRESKIIYQKPKWHFIRYDATDEEQGEVLVGYAILRNEDKELVPLENIYPDTRNYGIHLFLIGLRNINMDYFGFNKPNSFNLVLDVSGDQSQATITDKSKVEGNIINVNKYSEVRLDIPICKGLAPNLDVQMHAHYSVGPSNLAGYCSLNIAEQLQRFYVINNIPLAKPSTSLELKGDANILGGLLGAGLDDGKKKEEKKEEKKDKNTPAKSVISNEGLTKDVGQGQSLKYISTFRINENIEFDSSQREIDDDIDLDDIVLGNKADEAKGFAEDKEDKGVKKKLKKERKTVMDSIFGSKEDKVVYEDFDTIEKEDLDVTPAWLVNRDILDDEYEDFLKKNPADSAARILSYKMKTGSKRSKSKIDDEDPLPDPETDIATLKLIFIEGEKEEVAESIEQYKKLMEPKQMICRVYILDAMELSRDDKPSEKPSTYLQVKVGDTEFKDKEKTLIKDDYDPEYYKVYDFLINIPGCPFLTVNIWQDNDVLKDEILGTTSVDLEERYFNPDWQAKSIKPIEYRTLKRVGDNLPCGRLSLWVELLDPTIKVPKFDISPLEKVDCELRVIVWECKGYEIADEGFGSTDLFIRGKLANQGEWLETDTHWRARAKATFNWRWKFDMKLPVTARDYKGDILQLQLWDRDVMTSNTMLAETEIYLNQHKMLDKCYKRRAPVKMRKRYLDKKLSKYVDTEVFWVDVIARDPMDPNKAVNKGKVLLSVEVLPKEEAEKLKNAGGRDAPNAFPSLPEPSGRFSFDIFSPLKTLKELVGEKYYRKLCCAIWLTICCIIVIAVGYFIGTSAVGSAVANAGQ